MTSLSLPRLAAQDDADALARRLVTRAFGGLLKAIPAADMRAIVLTGAMTRGEGSVLRRLDGSLALLSDIDFLIVSSSPAAHRRLRHLCGRAARLATAELRREGLTSHVDYLPALTEQIRSWPSSISTNEALATGQLLRGDMPLASLFNSQTAPASIDPFDSLAMIHTRMMGQCAMWLDIRHPESPLREFAFYHTGKVITDLAAVILSFRGRFQCSVRARLDALADFLTTDEGRALEADIPGLMDRVSLWSRFKVDPDLRRVAAELGVEPTSDGLQAAWDDSWQWVRRALHRLWRWEVRETHGVPATATDDEAIARVLLSASPKAALKSWAKAWLHPNSEWRRLSVPRTLRHIAARRHALSLCYATAATLLFAARFPDSRRLAEAIRLAPVPLPTPCDVDTLLGRVCWLWRLMVKGGSD